MKKTKFYSIHEKLGAKIVDFAGYKMPVQYSSIIAEHKTVRTSVGVFDVSHMGEIFIRGEKALEFVQHITVNDASLLNDGRVQYSAMCYKDGGIVDDLLVYRVNQNEFMLVVNASNKDKDYNWMVESNSFGVKIDDESDEYSLLAVQGPKSKDVIEKICSKNLDLEYYHFFLAKIAGVDMIVSRTGYTGELGYELYFKSDEFSAEKIWNTIFEAGKDFNIQPVGLGARDSLRLEMGYCLYGNDIDQTTNPLEAGLGWITKLKKSSFIAKDVLVKVKDEGLKRKLVPMVSDEKAFPRHGYELFADGKKIGHITSGTVSPILEKAIALGYVDSEYAKEGNQINFIIRGKEVPAVVTKLPFVKV
ncbi:MAG: glycine cleavage system aminomethyltransferase GcvT [Ignavibacteriales bacterium]|nr:glycine cleavage system aminomethyltransferase GcvT [Ignavibacteriales bacterium]